MATMIPSSAQALYAHIHRLLDEHISVHLTTDYIECTQLRVFQALTGGLLPVSVDDPHSLVLPSDPLDDFIKEHCQIQLKDICERFPAAKDTQELIYCTINAKSIERTFASIFDDTFCGYSQNTDIFADSSMLSVYSISHTPKPGCSKTPHLVPLNLREVLSLNSVGPASVEEDEDTDTQTKDVLHCRLSVPVGFHDWKKKMVSCQASPFSTTHTSRTHYTESTFYNQFLCWTQLPPLMAPLPQTPPLFSRKDVAPKRPAHVPASMFDLQLVGISTSSDGDEGMLKYAVVDDEWATSSTLSPSTPCLSSSPSKRCELFVPSSEPQGPIDDLLAAKMDMFHMPRQSRVGGSREAFRVPGQGQQLHEYIGSAVCSTRGRDITTASSSAPNNIVTPPTSVHRVGAFPTPDNIRRSSDDSEDAFLGQLMLDFADETIDAVLLNQPADTRSGLMNVPQLPAPNVHIRNIVWPNDMKSLVTYKCSSSFNVVKGIKSLNFELTWRQVSLNRPYDSELAIPTVEELVGVSEFHHFLANISVDGDGTKSQLVELLNWLDSLTHPVSIEEESPGRLQAVLTSLTNFDFLTVVPNAPDCELSNVLPTRTERLRSRLLLRTQSNRTYEHAGQWDGGGCAAQSQSPGQSKADSLSEDNDYGKSTEPDSVDPGTLVRGRTLLSDPSEDVALDAEIDVVFARHMQLPVESAFSLPTGLSPNSDSIISPESTRSHNPDWIHPSKSGGHEGNHQLGSFGPATCDEQSLRGYLRILAKHPPSGQADNDKHLTSPAPSELRRLSTSPVDTEGLLRELSELATPLPPSRAPSNYNHRRYLASIELLQDRPLMHAFRLDSPCMELLEREWVDGADIVFDCDTALVFVPLFQVLHPSSFRSLKDRLSSLSWRYIRLAVVFSLYEASLQRPQDAEEVIRSIKKLQRGLAIAEAYATKRPQAVIQMYFVRSVEQAAATARLLGDVAESRSPFGPWGDRLWLGVDENEDERYLAGVDGMNAFAAEVILSQISLHDFLALRADQRHQLALPIPECMMERFNEVIAQRREDVDTFVGDEDSLL